MVEYCYTLLDHEVLGPPNILLFDPCCCSLGTYKILVIRQQPSTYRYIQREKDRAPQTKVRGVPATFILICRMNSLRVWYLTNENHMRKINTTTQQLPRMSTLSIFVANVWIRIFFDDVVRSFIRRLFKRINVLSHKYLLG